MDIHTYTTNHDACSKAGVGFSAPIYTYQNFRREEGLTVEESL